MTHPSTIIRGPLAPGSLGLTMPIRPTKPRTSGLTVLIDSGASTRYFEDVIASSAGLIDLVKFGWGTALVTEQLDQKIASLKAHHVGYFFGGTLFERCYLEDCLDAYVAFCQEKGCRFVEVSNGTVPLSNHDKAPLIRDLSQHFTVLSEVGYKDPDRSLRLHPQRWVEYIQEDLEAGAAWTIAEARESGTGGVCRADGEVRYGLIEEILSAGISSDRLIFEAPTKALQTYFIERVGANVNLANILLNQAIAVETLRLGLRSDTLNSLH